MFVGKGKYCRLANMVVDNSSNLIKIVTISIVGQKTSLGPTRGWYRNIHMLSIDYAFRLILGPDSPSVDEPCGGTLRFSGHWILTNVCVTQADILAFASSTLARAGPSP